MSVALPPEPELVVSAAPDLLDEREVAAGPWRVIWRRFRHDVPAMIGLVTLLLIVVVALTAPWIAPYSRDAQDLTRLNESPSADHLLGTDEVGRDLLTRLIYGARVSLQASFQIVLLAVVAALPIGLAAGYFGKAVDAVLMRVMDALFTFPPLLLALTVATLLGPSMRNASIAIALVFVPGFVRLVRALVLAVREETYIEASRSVGVGSGRMILRHVLPNVASPLVVQVALSFGYAMLAEAGLSFLGQGVQPPTPSWGVMLSRSYQYIFENSWPLVPPGLAIMITVLAFNLVGDGLRDALGRERFKVQT